MKDIRRFSPLPLASLVLLAACQDPNPPPTQETSYRPFNETNYASQKARVGLYQSMATLVDSSTLSASQFGAFDVNLTAIPTTARCVPTTSPTSGSIAHLFLQESLCTEVIGSVQRHSYATGVGTDQLGQDMHFAITTGIQAGATAQTQVELKAAGERVLKTFERFFYEAIYDAMIERTPRGWDQAFGYFGASNDGTTAAGLAAQIRSGDARVRTSLERELFVQFIQGRQELESALQRAGKSPTDPNASIAPGESQTLDRLITQIDEKMLLSLAYATAGEWDEWINDTAERPVEYAEGVAFTAAIQDYIRSRDQTSYNQLRAILDKPEAEFTQTDAQQLVTLIETTFGIDATP
ncbi:MAG TPA: hypothetical protein VH877_31105 [Polyangia bacterium]|jgi:hypothetical protein|nr:hypothetical protein [Polyangia bacterium]